MINQRMKSFRKRITDFTIKNMVGLLKERGEIFKGVLGKGMDMEKVLQKLEDAYLAR